MLEDNFSMDEWPGIYLIKDFSKYDEPKENIKTKLEITARDVRFKNGEMYATLVFHIKLWDDDNETYRDVYKTRVEDVLLYDNNLIKYDKDKNKLGGLEKLIKNYIQIGRSVGLWYENFLKDDGKDYNEIDENDKNSYLSEIDYKDLPQIYPVDFVMLIKSLSASMLDYYINDIENS